MMVLQRAANEGPLRSTCSSSNLAKPVASSPQKNTHRAIIVDDQLWNAVQTRPQEKAPPRRQKGKRQSPLLDAIETGLISVRDDGGSAPIKALRAEIDDLNAAKRTRQQQLDRQPSRITPDAVRRFGEIVRDRLHNGEANARQNVARAFLSKIHVVTNNKRSGDLDALARATASVTRSKGGLPSFDRKWCPSEDKDGHSDYWEILLPNP